MIDASPSPAATPDESYGSLSSIVAWPPEVLDTWMRRAQRQLNVSGFGAPHLNLRAPFRTSLSTPELVAALRRSLHQEPEFRVQLSGWKRLPGVIFLECHLSTSLADLHARLLAVGPSTRAPYDADDYRPHLTLALGVLPWAADDLWATVQLLTPPIDSFTVQALSLTREERGEVQELHTFPLQGPPVGAARATQRQPVGGGDSRATERPPGSEITFT